MYQDTLLLASNIIVDMRKRLQLTNALWLEDVVAQQKDGIDFTDSDYKNAQEAIEDAIDSRDDISYVEQLQVLPEDHEGIPVLKNALISDLHSQLKMASAELETKKGQLLSLMKNTPENDFSKGLIDFIDTSRTHMAALESTHTVFKNWVTGYQEDSAVDSLTKSQLPGYKHAVDTTIAAALEKIESSTCMKRSLRVQLSYEVLNQSAISTIAILIEKNNFLAAHKLADAQKKHAQHLKFISENMSSASAMKSYADGLEAAVKELAQLLITSQIPPLALIEQLSQLESLNSPYYKTLQKHFIDTTIAKIGAYTSRLDRYQTLLRAAIPIFEQQEADKLPALSRIEEKIIEKKIEIEGLKTTFWTRLHFWELLPVEIPLDDLPTAKLREYAGTIDNLIKQGLAELENEAEQAGFAWA